VLTLAPPASWPFRCDKQAVYEQSSYAYFCVPLFVLSSLYDLAVYLLGIKNLAARLVVQARKI
jgi:hypothetical protein